MNATVAQALCDNHRHRPGIHLRNIGDLGYRRHPRNDGSTYSSPRNDPFATAVNRSHHGHRSKSLISGSSFLSSCIGIGGRRNLHGRALGRFCDLGGSISPVDTAPSAISSFSNSMASYCISHQEPSHSWHEPRAAHTYRYLRRSSILPWACRCSNRRHHSCVFLQMDLDRDHH